MEVFIIKSKKRLLCGLLVIVTLLAVISQVSATDNLTADNIAVSDDSQIITTTYSPKNFTDLQNNIETAEDGDIIELNGTYEFKNTIKVNKSITIKGTDETIIKKDPFDYMDVIFFSIDSSASNVVLFNLKFSEGTVKWAGNDGSIINCQFSKITTDSGGALYVTGTGCNITECIFSENIARNGAGAAISLYGDNNRISNCEFRDNVAQGDNGDAGALLIRASNCIVENTNFTSNYCSNNGGAVAVYNEKNKFINNIFKSNYVKNNLTNAKGGGAIYSSCQGLNIINCTFEDNNAFKANGGAVILGEYNHVENSSFKGNMALTGNDIYANSTSYLFYNEIILDYGETQMDSIYGVNLQNTNTTFIQTKIDSSVTFTAGMVFEYGSSGTIHVIVEGGSVKLENIKVLNHPEAKITFINNVLTVSGLGVGKYTLRVTTSPDDSHNSVDADLSITVNKATAVIKASKVTVALKKGTFWKIKLVDSKSGKAIANMKLTLKVFTGKKSKTLTVTTNSNGEANYQTKGLTKGTHKVVISGSHVSYNFNTLTSSIKVIKPKKLTFKVKVSNDKDGSSLSITTNYKKKPINGVKLKLLVYTGKKYKTVILKSKTKGKYKGVAGWGTNKVSVGTHKVVVIPANIKYSGSKTVKINLKKSAKKYIAWETKI